jgi:hypothetical protein
MLKMIRKIISGGQTPADRAGLDFRDRGGPGTRRICSQGSEGRGGRIDDRYNLIELSTSSYPARTRTNIEKSDGTVIFSLKRVLSGGTKLTLELANKLGKPVLHIYDHPQRANIELNSRRVEGRGEGRVGMSTGAAAILD